MAHNVLVVGPNDRVFTFPVAKEVQTATLKEWLNQKLGTAADFHLTVGGVPLGEEELIPCGEEWGTTLIRAHPLLIGGKGGFGALIRAVGSRCNRKNQNKEACRDLSGRRLRDVNAQKRVTKWLEEEPERKRKKREEKRKRRLQKRFPPKHFFEDQAYMDQLRANEEDMDSALKQGLGASSHKGLKRKQPASDTPGTKKPKFWVGGMEGDDEDLSSGESEGDSEEDDSVGRGSDSSSSDQLNSAGSSDVTGQSKPSDDEQDSEQCTRPNGEEGVVNSIPKEEEESRNDDVVGEVLMEKEKEEATVEQCSEAPISGEDHQLMEQEEEKEREDAVTSGSSNDEQTQPNNNGPLDLNEYSSAVELESVGADRLKSVLQSLGLKCGGTLQERAQRLFATKGKSLAELDPSFFAKAGKKSRRQKNK